MPGEAAGPTVRVALTRKLCPLCHGVGTYKRRQSDGWWERERCQRCHGDGTVPREERT